MADHQIDKPTVFISHATSDAEFANAVQREIEKVFANGVRVFCTSSPGAIQAGSDWLGEIERKLNDSKAVIAIVTPISLERPWLWFELGATWSKSKTGDSRIYPLCTKEISLSELPPPLDRLQALSLGKASDLKLLFESLVEQFGFGNIKSFKASNITTRIPKYASVKIDPIDMNERTLYSGKYSGYSDEDLMEVLDQDFFVKENSALNIQAKLHIKYGKLYHFREIDKKLILPPETSRRLLVIVADKWNLKPKYISENSVRFEMNYN